MEQMPALDVGGKPLSVVEHGLSVEVVDMLWEIGLGLPAQSTPLLVQLLQLVPQLHRLVHHLYILIAAAFISVAKPFYFRQIRI